MERGLLILGTALTALLGAGTTVARTHDLPLKCQERVDEELARAGLQDFAHAASQLGKSSKEIDASAFVKNDVGQYAAYSLVEDDASRELVGELIADQDRGNVPADHMIVLSDHKPAKLVLFLKGQSIVGYSSNLLAQGAGKSIVLNSRCEPVNIHVTLPAVSPPYMKPVINLNRSDCSNLSALESIAKNVEIDQSETFFDGLCRVRGGLAIPPNHSIDDDVACECQTGGTIEPELENWQGPNETCLNPPKPSNVDRFASLISVKSTLANGGLQALVAQLKSPNSVIAQQCRIYF